jgi:hypothetical protein
MTSPGAAILGFIEIQKNPLKVWLTILAIKEFECHLGFIEIQIFLLVSPSFFVVAISAFFHVGGLVTQRI